jgi:MotA/TolQ/ExbB proton channel family protein
MVTLARFKRGIGTLATIATISPFVGLFGTVVGIIHAFRAIADKGGAHDFATVSSGIAEALVTTALGILVAIPAAWAQDGVLSPSIVPPTRPAPPSRTAPPNAAGRGAPGGSSPGGAGAGE